MWSRLFLHCLSVAFKGKEKKGEREQEREREREKEFLKPTVAHGKFNFIAIVTRAYFSSLIFLQ